ncbi:uncharacterized protein AruCF_1589 [Achromobacter ruhlandii]|nr:uncharacterized protein AruCF_1589 [Achromobacter ruhlandii]
MSPDRARSGTGHASEYPNWAFQYPRFGTLAATAAGARRA